jgi:pimeloyl-ACP methyl ester carboxylesterase
LHLGATVEFAAALFAVSGLLFPQMATLDVAKEFDAIRCPTLVIHGRDDFIPLESSETIHAGIGGARLEVLETGHFPFIERPEAFFRLVREFLASS